MARAAAGAVARTARLRQGGDGALEIAAGAAPRLLVPRRRGRRWRGSGGAGGAPVHEAGARCNGTLRLAVGHR